MIDVSKLNEEILALIAVEDGKFTVDGAGVISGIQRLNIHASGSAKHNATLDLLSQSIPLAKKISMNAHLLSTETPVALSRHPNIRRVVISTVGDLLATSVSKISYMAGIIDKASSDEALLQGKDAAVAHVVLSLTQTEKQIDDIYKEFCDIDELCL